MSDSARRRRQAGAVVGASQVLFGAALMLAPDAVGRPFGLRVEQPWVRWFARLYGVRDVATGLGLWYAAANPERARPWLAMEAVIQAFDAIATAAAWRSKAVPASVAAPIMAIAPLWVLMCVAGMLERDATEDDNPWAWTAS